MKTTIIFDLWNTLAKKEVGISTLFQEQFQIEDDDFMKKYEMAIHLKKWDSIRDMAIHLLFSFNIPLTEKNIRFTESLFRIFCKRSSLIGGAKKLLKKLNKNHDLILLSNTNNFETLKPDWGVTQLFDNITYSYQVGMLKPESLYLALIAQNKSPGRCLLIDDNHDNIEEARAIGMNAIHFQDMKSLRKSLVLNNII